MTKAKPSCSTCGDSGSVNVSTGGGTEPRTPGTPAVYGMRLSREPCPECQQRAVMSALSITDEATPDRTKEAPRVGDGKTTAPVDDVINALRAGTNRPMQQAAAVMLGSACRDIERLENRENRDSLAFKTLHAIYHERDFRVRVNDPTVDLVEKVLRKLVDGPMDNKRCPACEAGFENDDGATLLAMVK